MVRVMLFPLLVLVFAASTLAQNVVWYVSPSGSTNGTTCGRSLDEPCASLSVILDESSLFTEYYGVGCYASPGISDGRLSTTVYFLEGVYVLPAICLLNWRDLRIAGVGDVTVSTSYLGSSVSVFEFINCSNISMEHILFDSSSIGSFIIYAEDCSDFYITDCMLLVTALASGGIRVKNCHGIIVIANTVFAGNGGLASQHDPVIGFRVTQGLEELALVPIGPTPDYPPLDMLVINCTFHNFSTVEATSDVNDYSVSSSEAVGALVQFWQFSHDNILVFEDCTFQNLTNPAGSGNIVYYGRNSFNNTAIFRHSAFLDNFCRYGGGVAVYFFYTADSNLAKMDNCIFQNNKADFEGGGIFVVSLTQDPSNAAIVLDSLFTNNSAIYGSGVFLFNDPTWFSQQAPSDSTCLTLLNVQLHNNSMTNNIATLSEGVVNTLRISLRISGESNVFTGNYGSAIVLRFSLLYASGNLSFTHNKAINGGALKILDNSRVDVSLVTYAEFQFNSARFSGGAVYADDSSTTVTANEYNHTLAASVLGTCFMEFQNIYEPLPGDRLIFSNNTALQFGNDFEIYSLRSCQLGYFLPAPFTPSFISPVANNPVVLETDDPLLATSTGPSYLYFYGASCHCYKTVGNISFLLPNCSHQLLLDSFYGLPELQCSISTFLSDISTLRGPGAELHPTIDKMILPWAGIETSWMQTPGSLRELCFETIPGNLLLSPAPGEMFDLTVQLADQLLNYITGTVYLEIAHEPGIPPGVLMQLNGIQYAYTDRIYFTPNRALSGLALVGLPGTEGYLNILSESQILGLNIVLQLPFKLAQCPLGFLDPPGATTPEQVNQLSLTNYSILQRIPDDQPLACQCFKTTDLNFGPNLDFYPAECIDGYTVELSGILWAGLIPNDSNPITELPTVPCLNVSNTTDPLSLDTFSAWVESVIMEDGSNPAASPVDVVPYQGVIIPGGGAPVTCYENYTVDELVSFKPSGVEFTVDSCFRGFCNGTIETNWFLSDVNQPCVSDREGVLCGQCKKGLSITLTTTICRDCSDPKWYIPLLSTLFLGLLLVVCAVVFNIGVSATVDSLLFFLQSVYVIVSDRIGYTSFQSLAIVNLDFTFDLCIMSNLTALTRLLLQYITPLYIMFLMVGVLVLTRVKGPSKYLGRHSFLHALWLLILVSYLNISYSTFEILHCRFIGPVGAYELVFVYDPSVFCWMGVHLPWAIVSTILLASVIVPFPFYAGLAIRFSKFKPITDIYSGVYRDSQRYWVIWGLLRRFLLVILGVFISNFFFRHFSLLMACILMLTIFILTWPYRSWIDNAFGAFVSIALIVFCVITQPELYQYTDPSTAVSWMIVALVVLVGCLLLLLEVVLKVLPKFKPEHKYTKDEIFPGMAVRKLSELYSMFHGIMSKRQDSLELEDKQVRALERSPSVYTRLREPLLDNMTDVEESKRTSLMGSSSRSRESANFISVEYLPVSTNSSSGRTTDRSSLQRVTYSKVSL